jgi:hypothetical protein
MTDTVISSLKLWTKKDIIKKYREDPYIRQIFPTLKDWIKYFKKVR